VEKRFGVPPERLPAYVALVGDTSDNIPKVKGIGPVAAQKLIAAHADVASLLGAADRIEPARLRALVLEHATQLEASEALARLRKDVPLPEGPRHAALDADAVERTRAMFEELEFKSLVSRLEALTPSKRQT
jgi:DNA polymerase-1